MRKARIVVLALLAASAVRAQEQDPYPYLYHVTAAQRELRAARPDRAEQHLDACPEAQRGWEWRYLRAQCRPELRRIDLERPVSAVAFGPYGLRVALATGGGVHVFAAETGELERTFDAISSACAFSPDGGTLAVAGRTTVQLFDVVTGEREGLREMDIDGSPIMAQCLAFSGDGSWLALGSGWSKPRGGGTLVLSHIAVKGQTAFSDPYWINAVAFSPDGQRLVTASGDVGQIAPWEPGRLRLWGRVAGKEERTFEGHEFWVMDAAFSPDGRRVVSAGADGTVRVWDVESGASLRVLEGHRGWVRCVAFDRRGRRIASGGDDKIVRLWDAATGELLASWAGHRSRVTHLAFDPKSDRLLSAGGREALLWKPGASVGYRAYAGNGRPIRAVGLTADGLHVVAADSGRRESMPGQVTVLAAASGEVRYRLELEGQGATEAGVALAPSAPRFAVATPMEGVEIRSLATGKRLASAGLRPSYEARLAYDPNGRWLAVAAGQRGVIVDAKTGAVARRLGQHTLRVIDVAWGPAGERVATVSMGGHLAGRGRLPAEVALWNAATGEELVRFTGEMSRVVFAPAGDLLATAGRDGRLRLWKASTGELLHELVAHTDGVRCLAFSPDGARLATGGADGTLRLWDPRTGAPTLVLEAHGGAVTSVAFSADGRSILTGGEDGAIKMWTAGA